MRSEVDEQSWEYTWQNVILHANTKSPEREEFFQGSSLYPGTSPRNKTNNMYRFMTIINI